MIENHAKIPCMFLYNQPFLDTWFQNPLQGPVFNVSVISFITYRAFVNCVIQFDILIIWLLWVTSMFSKNNFALKMFSMQ